MAAGLLVLGVVAAILTAFAHRDQPSSAPNKLATPPSIVAPIPVPPVTAEQLRRLPETTTDTTIAAAPTDERPDATPTSGVVAHNGRASPVFTAPGGSPFARLPVRQLGNDTWLPVIAEQPGWVRVLLPSRPNGSTGWLAASQLTLAHTPYDIRVDLSAARLHLLRHGRSVGEWTVSVGTSRTPTPTGRTFLLAAITDRRQPFSPVILPLGSHSTTLDTYAGGPGTVGIHTWPRKLDGRPASHGCIRVPPVALRALAAVPLGSLVHIQQ